MRSVFGLIGEHDCAVNDLTPTLLTALMAITLVTIARPRFVAEPAADKSKECLLRLDASFE